MNLSGDHGPARNPAADPSQSLEIESILAGLSGEIRRPLALLHAGIGRLLADPLRPISDAERIQARTMLGLCEDLNRLTRECLEGATPPAEA